MLILYGIHNGVEKPRSLVKLCEVKQGDRECPLAFYEWLCEVAHKWTNLDLEGEGNRMLLNMLLIGQLALDIRNLFGKKNDPFAISGSYFCSTQMCFWSCPDMQNVLQ